MSYKARAQNDLQRTKLKFKNITFFIEKNCHGNPATVNIDQNKEDIEHVIPVVAAPCSV